MMTKILIQIIEHVFLFFVNTFVESKNFQRPLICTKSQRIDQLMLRTNEKAKNAAPKETSQIMS